MKRALERNCPIDNSDMEFSSDLTLRSPDYQGHKCPKCGFYYGTVNLHLGLQGAAKEYVRMLVATYRQVAPDQCQNARKSLRVVRSNLRKGGKLVRILGEDLVEDVRRLDLEKN